MKSLFTMLFAFGLFISSQAQVENDLCADASPLLSGQTILINNTQANQNEGIFGECWGFGQGEAEQTSLWYTFETPDEPFTLSIEAFGDGSNTFTDTQFGLFEECGGEMIACDGNSGNGLFSAFNFACGGLNPASSYILMVDGWNGDNGTCFLTMNIGECGDSLIYGCTDPLALNYNPQANVEDGSCVYDETCNGVEAQILIQAENDLMGSWLLTNSQGFVASDQFNNVSLSYDLCLTDECYELIIFADSSLNSTFWLSITAGDFFIGTDVPTNGEPAAISFEVGTGCDSLVYGCTDPNALNFNPFANIDDGSCVYADCPSELIIEQWDCNNFVFYLGDGLIENGSWYINGDLHQIGSVETYFLAEESGTYEVCYYDPNNDCSEVCESFFVNTDCFNSCVEGLYYTSNSDSCEFTFFAEPLNYTGDVLWNFGDGTSIIAGTILDYEFGIPGAWDVCASFLDSDCQSIACVVVESEDCGITGCMDPNAINYNPNATIDDGSCVYSDCDGEIIVEQLSCINYVFEVNAGNQENISGVWTVNGASLFQGGSAIDWIAPGPGTYDICYTYFLGDSSACSLCEAITIPDDCFDLCIESLDYLLADSCTYIFFANPFFEGEEVFWDFGDGTNLIDSPLTMHQYEESGTYTVCAFYANALCDAVYCVDIEVQSCEIYGCMDPLASNYNPLATIDDGTCTYDFSCEIGFSLVPDTTGLNTIWIIPQFGDGQPDSVFWSFGDGTTSSELYPQHAYEGEGPFELCLSASLVLPNGGSCSGTFCAIVSGDMVDGSGFTSSGFTINVVDPSVLSTEEESDISGLNIYPNPSADRLWIEIPVIEDPFLDLNIFDMRGVQVYETRIQNNRAGMLSELDINNLAPGTYVLSLKGNTKFTTRPFIVVR